MKRTMVEFFIPALGRSMGYWSGREYQPGFLQSVKVPHRPTTLPPETTRRVTQIISAAIADSNPQAQ